MQEEYQDCLQYIEDYWEKIIHKPAKKRVNHHIITIPHPYITPNDKKFSYMFYWDTFFMFRGLIRTKNEWVLRSMVDNLTYLYEKHGIIPNFNSPGVMGRSQPPFFTSMILDTYNGYLYAKRKENSFLKLFASFSPYKRWLAHATEIAKREYEHVWIDKEGFFHHSVPDQILNRYGDRDIGYAHSSELESGWDFTSRFFNRCDEFFPVDLNVFLFKYERDFAKIAQHLENPEEEKRWQIVTNRRKAEINKYLWNDEVGFFFDYDYKAGLQSDFLSLAGFTPLWAGLATAEQAAKMVRMLPRFESEHGLIITAKESLPPYMSLTVIPYRFRPALDAVLAPKQWDYPHIWPPLEYLTVIGLLKYGYIDHATRIMKKSLAAEAAIFRKHQTFFEKIDGLTGDRAKDYHYANQSGFGWTNAVFYRYVHILDSLQTNEDIYQQPNNAKPPFKLAIPH